MDDEFITVPLVRDDWPVSTPSEQGMDPDLVDQLFKDAAGLRNLYSLLIIKNGYLVAEGYFNGQGIDSANPIASVTKSYTSALTGIALNQNILFSLDQKMVEFFPELDWQSMDPRKSEITLRQILQMRSGYPWEEFEDLIDPLFSNLNWIPLLKEFELSSDPGTTFGYSNLTAHMMAVILARASNTSLLDFAQGHLFEPLDVNIAFWPQDVSGYYFGSGDMHITPRDMAKFGLLYLNGGSYAGVQILSPEWVTESLQSYSAYIYGGKIGAYFYQLEYGYLWWSARAGRHDFNYAWGHGGNMIILVHDLDMVIVTMADNLVGQFSETAWDKERAVIDLVGEFITSIP